MKKLLFIVFMTFFCIRCEKEKLDIENPDVEIFVKQLKNGTYAYFEKGEKGENLWLLMPKFTMNHIQSLIDFSKDTSHIAVFPTNPFSSRKPLPDGREYYVLGECLLWIIEGIRHDSGYGSLDPYLIDVSKPENERFKGLNGDKIRIVSDLYKDWWNNFKDKAWRDKNPLAETSYRWY